MRDALQNQLVDAVRALGEGRLDIAGLARAIDTLLGGGNTVEELCEEVHTAQATNRINPDEAATLIGVISETMTIFAGDAENDDRTALYVQEAPESDGTPADPLIGTRLRDRFIVDEVLGVGGMGTVYKGRDALKVEARDRNPYIAIKVLNESFARRPDAFIALQREASRQQSLAHPNIATVFDFDRSGKTVFITMELLQGTTLDKFIRAEVRPRGGLPLKEALPLIEAMCAALKHAHDRGIVHADFKPGNCFISEQRELKVLDFGIARAMKDPNAPPRDQTLFDPRLIGAMTPAYASPEMLDNSADPDPRDDIYALACVAYELLSGGHPFMRVPANAAQDQGLKPGRIKSLSRRHNETLQRGLAFERNQRIGSATELLRGLSMSEQRPLAKIAAGVLVVAALSAGAVFTISYVDRMNAQRLLSQIASGDAAVVTAAIEQMQQEEPEIRQRMLLDGRERLLEYFRARFDALASQPADAVPFAEIETLLATGEGLYPDSAALRDLRAQFVQQRARYLTDLAQRFEAYLKSQYLVPSIDQDDLHDVLHRIREVDPGNALLSDMRVASAYAAAATGAMERGELTAAHQLVASGLGLREGDPALLDIRDRIAEAEAAEQTRKRLAQLRTQLGDLVARVASPADLAPLEAPLMELEKLAPEGGDAATAGNAVVVRLKGDIEPLLQAEQLPGLSRFLDGHAAQLRLLRQQDLLDRLQARRSSLIERRDALVQAVRLQLGATQPLAARQAAISKALAGIASVDPGYLQDSPLAGEIVQAQLAHVEAASIDNKWEPALAELEMGLALGLADTATAPLTAKRAEIERRKQEYVAQIEGERAAESERRRREEIARLEASLQEQHKGLGFDKAGIGALRSAASRLQALDPSNPLVATTYASATSAFLERADAAARDGDDAGAQALLDLAAEIAPDQARVQAARAAAAATRERLESERRSQQVAQAMASIETLLTDSAALDTDTHQKNVRSALSELAGLAPDPAELAATRARVANAYVDRCRSLIDERRFSSAESLLGAAESLAPGLPAVAQTRQLLEQQRTQYAAERRELELQARIQGGRERFGHEVESVQLTRATQTLREMTALAPTDAFFAREAPQLLADAYAKLAQRSIAAGKFNDAAGAIKQGRAALPGDARFDALERTLLAQRAQQGIDAWISGKTPADAARVRGWIAEFERNASPVEVRDAAESRSRAVHARLQALRSEPDTHNRALSEFQAVFTGDARLAAMERLDPPPVVTPRVAREVRPDSKPTVPSAPVAKAESEKTRPLAGSPPAVVTPPVAAAQTPVKQPEPAVPTLGAENLLGKWCSKDAGLEFDRDALRFVLGRGQSVEYRVERYHSDAPATLTVSWRDQRKKLMLFEFGAFSADGKQMTQLRGRAEDGDWQRYDRVFQRCT